MSYFIRFYGNEINTDTNDKDYGNVVGKQESTLKCQRICQRGTQTLGTQVVFINLMNQGKRTTKAFVVTLFILHFFKKWQKKVKKTCK